MERKSKSDKPVRWRLVAALGLAALGCGTNDLPMAAGGLFWAFLEGKYMHKVNSRTKTIEMVTDIVGPPPSHDSEPVYRETTQEASHELLYEAPSDQFVYDRQYDELVDISEPHRRRLMRQAFEVIDKSGEFDVSSGQTEQIQTIFINNPKV